MVSMTRRLAPVRGSAAFAGGVVMLAACTPGAVTLEVDYTPEQEAWGLAGTSCGHFAESLVVQKSGDTAKSARLFVDAVEEAADAADLDPTVLPLYIDMNYIATSDTYDGVPEAIAAVMAGCETMADNGLPADGHANNPYRVSSE